GGWACEGGGGGVFGAGDEDGERWSTSRARCRIARACGEPSPAGEIATVSLAPLYLSALKQVATSGVAGARAGAGRGGTPVLTWDRRTSGRAPTRPPSWRSTAVTSLRSTASPQGARRVLDVSGGAHGGRPRPGALRYADPSGPLCTRSCRLGGNSTRVAPETRHYARVQPPRRTGGGGGGGGGGIGAGATAGADSQHPHPVICVARGSRRA